MTIEELLKTTESFICLGSCVMSWQEGTEEWIVRRTKGKKSEVLYEGSQEIAIEVFKKMGMA